MRPRFRSVFLPVLSIVALSLEGPVFAQQSRVPAPHKPAAPRLARPQSLGASVRQSAVGGLWMTDANMKSSLYLKNDLKANSLIVTPILYLSNGVRYSLEAVTLEPSGTAVVDINQALAQQGIAPYATLYGYAEIEYQWPWAAVCGTIRNVDLVNSVIFMDTLQPPPEAFPKDGASANAKTAHNFEGLWWKQESDVTGFVALSNATAELIHATVRLTDSNDVELESEQVAITPHGTKMLTLGQLSMTTSDWGGIYLTHDGTGNGLVINGGLEDKSVGYSARLFLAPSLEPPAPGTSQTASDFTIAELGLMSGAADPMMNFPATQYYRFQCASYQNGAWINITGPINIQRVISQNSDGTWQYTITKSGASNSVNPLP